MYSFVKPLKYTLNIRLFQGYACEGYAVEDEFPVEVELSDQDVSKIRQLVKDFDGDKQGGFMPILESGAPELHERIQQAIFKEIYEFYFFDI